MAVPTRRGPQPWPGCDESGEEWRRYCEAWAHVYTATGRSLKQIENFRGKEAAEILEHDIEVVKADYAGEIPVRSDLQKHMQWKPKPPPPKGRL